MHETASNAVSATKTGPGQHLSDSDMRSESPYCSSGVVLTFDRHIKDFQ